eukprot:2079728-Amphidinium_carterae.1
MSRSPSAWERWGSLGKRTGGQISLPGSHYRNSIFTNIEVRLAHVVPATGHACLGSFCISANDQYV